MFWFFVCVGSLPFSRAQPQLGTTEPVFKRRVSSSDSATAACMFLLQVVDFDMRGCCDNMGFSIILPEWFMPKDTPKADGGSLLYCRCRHLKGCSCSFAMGRCPGPVTRQWV